MPLWTKPREVVDADRADGKKKIVRYYTYQAKRGQAGDILSGYGKGEYETPPSIGVPGKLREGVDVGMKIGEVVKDPKEQITAKTPEKDKIVPNDTLNEAKKEVV